MIKFWWFIALVLGCVPFFLPLPVDNLHRRATHMGFIVVGSIVVAVAVFGLLGVDK